MSSLSEIQDRITTAAKRSGRESKNIRLIAVSKTKPLAAVQSLLNEGQIDFGENTLQDAQTKIPYCKDRVWHFIGHLQSNKTKYIPELFAWVHSVDSLKLAQRINTAAKNANKKVNILLQVNIARDNNKAGISIEELFPITEKILTSSLDNIALKGLMMIGQRNATINQTRKTFRKLYEAGDEAGRAFDPVYFSELSMGMSQDFELAIEEGATMVRVGTALFRARL